MHEEEKLSDVHPDETFKAHTGDEVKNLNQLLDVLNDISQDSFHHHVNEDKNDFANWIRNSVRDEELADILERTLDFEKTKQIIRDRILLLEKKVEVKKIKENLESLKTDTIGIDKIPDDMQVPEKPEEDSEEKPEEHPEEKPEDIPENLPKGEEDDDDTYKFTPKEPEEMQDVLAMSDRISDDEMLYPGKEKHPFEYLKEKFHLRFFDILIGMVIGLFIGFLIGAYIIG